MAKEAPISVEGEVLEALGNGLFKVQLVSEHVIICHPSGKIRMNNIDILPGDNVTVEMSIYDLQKGRIVRRNIPDKQNLKNE